MRWKLKDKEVVVRTYHSGPVEDYTVRILWSNKLGLCHQHTFTNIEQAEAFAIRVKEVGVINPDRWKADYYPSKSYLEKYAD